VLSKRQGYDVLIEYFLAYLARLKEPLMRPWRKWKDNTNINRRDMLFGTADWIKLIQDMVGLL
jgi:hypothetical protein